MPFPLHAILALAIGAATAGLSRIAGWGAGGALILGSLVATVVFSFAGGNRRVLLVCMATMVPFLVSQGDNLLPYLHTGSFAEALSRSAPAAAGAFGLLVALPMAVVAVVHYLRTRR